VEASSSPAARCVSAISTAVISTTPTDEATRTRPDGPIVLVAAARAEYVRDMLVWKRQGQPRYFVRRR
jgi:hypothetical protein